jgi:hypothetical protein
MSRAGTSIFVFSFWVLGSGVALLFYPTFMLGFIALSTSAALVARIFGMVLLILGFYYFMAGRHGGMTDFYRWTTYTRPAAFVIALLLVVTGQAPPLLIAFVMVDVLGAAWTFFALRQDAQARSH